MTDTVIYFSGWQWCPGGNARHDGLMEALSNHVRIIYAQPPEFSALVEIRKPRIERVNENFWLIHHIFGARLSRVGRRARPVAAAFDSMCLRRLLLANGVSDYIYWTSSSAADIRLGMDTNRFVFDCIDPCFTPESQAKVDKAESEAGHRAKIVFASAETLLERMKSINPRSYLLPNAVRASDYHPSVLAGVARPKVLLSCSRPVVGYMGTIDWRIDTETLTYAAKALPGFTFCLVGRVNQDQESRVKELRSLANVIFTGAVSNEDGRAYTAHCDLAVIPFLPGNIGDGINPCKMYMYLMAGKPVVTTWMRECIRLSPLVTATRSAGEFVSTIMAAAENDTPALQAGRTELAMLNRWEDRAARALLLLSENGLLK